MKKSPPPVHQIELRIIVHIEHMPQEDPAPLVRRGRIYSNLGRATVHVSPWKA